MRKLRLRPLLLVGALAVAFAACGTGTSPNRSDAEADTVLPSGGPSTVTVSPATQGRPIPAGFVGLSIELNAIEQYAGTDPNALNPVFLQLVRNLNPSQSPVLRLGGDTTDLTWWPVPGMRRPAGVRITLTPRWLQVTAAMTRALSARLIPGIDLEADSARLAGAEARAFVSAIGRSAIAALELGNEPELYGQFTWGRSGKLGRTPPYALSQFETDLSRIGGALPHLPLAGPATGAPSWFLFVRPLLAAQRRLRVVTLHRYPLQQCYVAKTSPKFPRISHLLADYASIGLAASIAPYAGLVHSRGRTLRIDEMNTVSCGGAPGVSNTFASALWAVDSLFAMARVGVDGVNIHTFPGSTYELFRFDQVNGTWEGAVAPEYYGLMLFAQAAPRGSRLLRATVTRANGVKAWATRAPDGTVRVVLTNRGGASRAITLQAPAGATTATMQLLRAPSLAATGGVSFGGQSFGSRTKTGTLAGTPSVTTLTSASGRYALTLPAATAALITVPHP